MGRKRERPTRPTVLGSRVAAARAQLGWKLVDLSNASGIAHTTLSRIEGGHIQQIRSGPLLRIAFALRVSTDYLLGSATLPRVPLAVEKDPTTRQVARVMGDLPMDERRRVLAFALKLRGREPTELTSESLDNFRASGDPKELRPDYEADRRDYRADQRLVRAQRKQHAELAERADSIIKGAAPSAPRAATSRRRPGRTRKRRKS